MENSSKMCLSCGSVAGRERMMLLNYCSLLLIRTIDSVELTSVTSDLILAYDESTMSEMRSN